MAAVIAGGSKVLIQSDVTNIPELFLRNPDWHVAFDVDPIRDQFVDLRKQGLDIQHNPIADRASYARMQNPARNLVEYERFVGDVHGVTGVCPALVANDPVRALGEDIHQLALAFISPLRADDDDGACIGIEHQRLAGGGGGTSSMTRGGSSGRTTLLTGSTTVNVEPFPKTLSATT